MLQLQLSTDQASEGAQEEACEERQGPAHTATADEAKAKQETDVSVERGETAVKTSEGQESEPVTAAASGEG